VTEQLLVGAEIGLLSLCVSASQDESLTFCLHPRAPPNYFKDSSWNWPSLFIFAVYRLTRFYVLSAVTWTCDPINNPWSGWTKRFHQNDAPGKELFIPFPKSFVARHVAILTEASNGLGLSEVIIDGAGKNTHEHTCPHAHTHRIKEYWFAEMVSLSQWLVPRMVHDLAPRSWYPIGGPVCESDSRWEKVKDKCGIKSGSPGSKPNDTRSAKPPLLHLYILHYHLPWNCG